MSVPPNQDLRANAYSSTPITSRRAAPVRRADEFIGSFRGVKLEPHRSGRFRSGNANRCA